MKKYFYQTSIGVLFVLTTISCGIQKSSTAKNALIGTWQICNSDGVVEQNLYGNKDQIRYKIISTDKFTLIDLNSRYNKVLNSFVGSYTIDKNIYKEHILFTNSNFNNLLKDTYSYKYKVKDDLLTIEGIGNPYIETWKRVQ